MLLQSCVITTNLVFFGFRLQIGRCKFTFNHFAKFEVCYYSLSLSLPPCKFFRDFPCWFSQIRFSVQSVFYCLWFLGGELVIHFHFFPDDHKMTNIIPIFRTFFSNLCFSVIWIICNDSYITKWFLQNLVHFCTLLLFVQI